MVKDLERREWGLVRVGPPRSKVEGARGSVAGGEDWGVASLEPRGKNAHEALCLRVWTGAETGGLTEAGSEARVEGELGTSTGFVGGAPMIIASAWETSCCACAFCTRRAVSCGYSPQIVCRQVLGAEAVDVVDPSERELIEEAVSTGSGSGSRSGGGSRSSATVSMGPGSDTEAPAAQSHQDKRCTVATEAACRYRGVGVSVASSTGDARPLGVPLDPTGPRFVSYSSITRQKGAYLPHSLPHRSQASESHHRSRQPQKARPLGLPISKARRATTNP